MALTKAALQCLELFDQNTRDVNDKRLVAWIRLQMVAEEAETARVQLQECAEGSTCHDQKMMDHKLIQALEDRLGAWRDASQGLMNSEFIQTQHMKRHSLLLTRLVAHTFLLLPKQALRACNTLPSKSKQFTNYLESCEPKHIVPARQKCYDESSLYQDCDVSHTV